MEKIYLFDQSFLTEYLTKMENATKEDIEAATNIYGEYVPDDILSIEGDTAHINISGPLSQSGPSPLARFFGYNGTAYSDIIDSIQTAEDNPAINKIILDMNTPGGEVSGVEQVSNAISNAKKEVIAVNHGLIASAGYWIASPANKILAKESTSRTGSVGVVISIVDYSKAEENYGIKRVEIVSKNAPNKRPDINTKKGLSVLQEQADAIENVFIETVAKGRGITTDYVIENFASGGILIANNPDGNDAVKAGMIDGMLAASSINSKSNNDGYNAIEDNETTPLGENTEESMDLKEFLASNPTAQAEYDSNIANAKATGVEEGKSDVEARIKKVAPIMASESYDSALKAQAQKALDGDMSIEAFESVVAMEDMRIEREKSTQAVAETETTGATPAQETEKPSADGSVNSEADFQATMARAKAGN